MTALAFAPATELARRIRAREISCVELLDYFLARLDKYNPRVNAVIVRDIETARARAVEADYALARDADVGPLHGVPMTIKESFNLKGQPTTWGFPEFRNNIAQANAVAVDRLIDAGAVIFGKTNVPPGLMDGQSANEIYGRTNNPWDLARTPGGSSGGSAAALAAGLTALELGSDIASSIRNPAHYCGLFGHKPTWGLCPTRGHSLIDMLSPTDIAVIGPLARSVADLEVAFSVIAGPSGAEADAYSLTLPKPRKTALKDFKVALVTDDSFAEVDGPVRDQLGALGARLEREGVKVVREARPEFDSFSFYILFLIMLRAAASAGVPEPEFRQCVEYAQGVTRATRDIGKANAYGVALTHRDWSRLDEERRRYQGKWREFFETYDLLLCPVLSSAAFPHAEGSPQGRMLRLNGHDVPFENQLFWAGYGGLCLLPATVAPIGLTPEGLPVGVQIIGPQYGDLTCLRFAKLLEDNI
ncbi:MAG TPA: amidase, partial [Rhizomicrobium sp.]|nr:amidase [Rhizomicrobium sp.]